MLFRSACSLHVGDNLVSDDRKQGVSSFINPNNPEKPIVIEDVFTAFSKSPSVFATSVPTASEDFHGDAKRIIGQVDVVGTNRLLADEIKSALFQHGLQFDFVPTDIMFNHSMLSGLSDSTFMFGRFTDAPNSVISSGGQSFAVDRVGSTHSDIHTFGSVAGCDVIDKQPTPDCSSGYTESFGQGQFAFPVGVSFDKIVDIEFGYYSGHVYDLQSLEGLYVIDGIIVHNCRCTLLPIFKNKILNEKNRVPKKDIWGNVDFAKGDRRFGSWMRKQSPEIQQQFFGSKLKFDSWKKGLVDMRTLVKPDLSVMNDVELTKHLLSKTNTPTQISVKRSVTNLYPKSKQKTLAAKVIEPADVIPELPQIKHSRINIPFNRESQLAAKRATKLSQEAIDFTNETSVKAIDKADKVIVKKFVKKELPIL